MGYLFLAVALVGSERRRVLGDQGLQDAGRFPAFSRSGLHRLQVTGAMLARQLGVVEGDLERSVEE